MRIRLKAFLNLRRALLLVFYGGLLVYLYCSPTSFRPTTVAQVRSLVAGCGFWGPLVYVGLYTVRPLLLLPSLLLNLAAGVLFTPVLGIPALLLGGLGSASLLFAMARLGLGSSLLADYGGKWGGRLHTYLSEGDHSFVHMLWLRTVPLFPYDVISLVAGCTGLGYRPFALATLVGMVPGAVAYNILSDRLQGGATLEGAAISAGVLLVAFGLPLGFWYFGGEGKRLR